MIALRGALTAMVTPMNADGSVDYEGFRKNVAFQLEKGIDGLVPLGTTGETPTLAEDEEERMITIVLEAVRAHEERTGRRVPVVVGAGSNNTADAVRYCMRAKAMGADAALVVTPYYNRPSDEGIFRHFEAVAQVGIPIVVYNIAGRTGKNIPTPLLARIAALPNVIGVKEASGDINQMMAVIATVKATRPDFAVLSGDDALTLPLVALGGDGIVSVVSNLAPAEVTEMTAAALSGDMQRARALHYRLLPFFKAAFVDGNPTSIKYAMNCKGMPAGTVRLPLVEVTDAAKQVIADALRESAL